MPKTTPHRTKTITVRVGPKLRAELQRYAELREMSVGEFVRYCALVYMDTTAADPDADLAIDPDEEYQRGQRDLAQSGGALVVGEVRRG